MNETGAGYVVLGYGQVALAVLLIVINAVVSAVLRLGLAKRLAVSATRTVVQLVLIGWVLQFVFSASRLWVILALGSLMVLVAGHTAVRASGRRWRGQTWDAVLSIWASSWALAVFALVVVVRPQPWFSPQFAIPLLGMLLGNALNGVSLGLDRLGDTLVRRRDWVETVLALGGSRWEAARGAVREAVRTGMTPILNTMSVVGVVSLPGMMTGQLLAGAPPAEAVKYQIVIMFLIAAATALGTLGVVLLGYRRLFSPEHRFLFEKLRPA